MRKPKPVPEFSVATSSRNVLKLSHSMPQLVPPVETFQAQITHAD